MAEVGRERHEQAVARLKASYDAIAPGQRVRLAKRTSNLFRPRDAVQTPGLDVSGLTGVISVDPQARTADVQGMCTYEDLVDATLQHGLIPLVVPQLRTITLGGAVTGMGIESTSFRNGLPHESVLEMDVFTGAGEVVTATPDNEHAQLFATFPNSYGSLGYATRLRIELEPIAPLVELQHLRFDDMGLLAKTIGEIVDTREYDGRRVDGLDGVFFEPGEAYLTLARWREEPAPGAQTSDYTRDRIFYQSLQHRETDLLTAYDYLWRWDTDWFWCSGAFGLKNPVVRALWPRRWKRSDVYHKLVGLDTKYGVADFLDRRAGRPKREKVIQDIEVPVERLPEFLEWFDDSVGMRPVWLCPLRLRDTPETPAHAWPSYPLEAGTTYVNAGFWGTVHVGPEAAQAPTNRAIEREVRALGGHKSLYSEAFYDRSEFDRLYGGPNLEAVKGVYDPDGRFPTLYDKAVRRG
ncbi:FAD-linked oxidase [Marmoricola endophyticus]|uniref:Delta(24)-sterol reductase n=1 Tax=Marmoricola endophyticus TaxID=2040280 RepID=A0A917BA72_9ACTN|nr:FAD-binding oxidoreductase [Marmoricola endophyticus]GGF31797.1 FAD-linked oxidase [Marmoricola endophyticus]